jgi:uncharacterized membrane protein YfcA
MDPLVVLFGFGVGILIGLTGVGGGSLMTPLLIFFLGTQPVVAIGTDLAYGALTKTLGAWRHLRKGTVDRRVALWLAAGSCPGAVGGVVAVEAIERHYGDRFSEVLLTALGCALFLVGIAVIVRALFLQVLLERERDTVPMTPRTKAMAVALGLVLGAILGMTSVGSGALIGLALIVVFRLTPQRVVGTDVFQASILMWVAGLTHLAYGNVDVGLMVNILVGSLPGVWIGASLVTRGPTAGLRIALGVILFASALGILKKAGADYGLGIVIGAPLALAVLCWLIHRIRSPRPQVSPTP